MDNIITVTALNRYVRGLLERDAVLTDVALRGEISNFTNHYKTGHFYFTLRDEQCSVKAVMFRSNAQALAFMPENGMRVVVHCRISLFERDGAFQVYVEDMFPDGVGALQVAFEQLKARLEQEGLFAPQHKKPLPVHPQCVGLVTSKTGAALQDILNVTRRRCPMAHLLLCPVTVQGEQAAPEIARAIETLDAQPHVDVIIVARGGGSREDLWVFNNEQIARAAFACKTPLVSAVGHEIDFSILDFVADLRAPTPSAAAELVMPDVWAEQKKFCAIYTNICKEIQTKLALCYNTIERYRHAPALVRLRTLPQREMQQIALQKKAINAAMYRRLTHGQETLAHAAMLAESLSPYKVLARGYAVAQNAQGTVLKNSAQAAAGDSITVQLHQGRLQCVVQQAIPDTEQEWLK